MIEAWHVMMGAGVVLFAVLCVAGQRGRSIIVMALTIGILAMQALAYLPLSDDAYGLLLWTGVAFVLFRYAPVVAALCLASAICYPMESIGNYFFPQTHPSVAIQIISNAFWWAALATAGGGLVLARRIMGGRGRHYRRSAAVAPRGVSARQKAPVNGRADPEPDQRAQAHG